MHMSCRLGRKSNSSSGWSCKKLDRQKELCYSCHKSKPHKSIQHLRPSIFEFRYVIYVYQETGYISYKRYYNILKHSFQSLNICKFKTSTAPRKRRLEPRLHDFEFGFSYHIITMTFTIVIILICIFLQQLGCVNSNLILIFVVFLMVLTTWSSTEGSCLST